MENGCLARMNLIGTRGKPETVSGVPLKGLNGWHFKAPGYLLAGSECVKNYKNSSLLRISSDHYQESVNLVSLY
jgi:hypothetical protein